KKGTGREAFCMVEIEGTTHCIDPAGSIFDLLGKRWTLPLIGVLGNSPVVRFSELRDRVSGIGNKALADRLKQMERLRLVERQAFPQVPVRVEYRLTPEGEQLRRALGPLLAWAAKAIR
ncbi:HxlR family transcriptional regulator, partial [mine drainage metagenome]